MTSAISVIYQLGKWSARQRIKLLSVVVSSSLSAWPTAAKLMSDRVVRMSDNSSWRASILFRWQELVKVAQQLQLPH